MVVASNWSAETQHPDKRTDSQILSRTADASSQQKNLLQEPIAFIHSLEERNHRSESLEKEQSDSHVLHESIKVPKNKTDDENKSSKAKKTLQESQAEVSKQFNCKIVKNSVGFNCKNCKNFGTTILYRAKYHAMVCGNNAKKQKKRRSRKKFKCSECEEAFSRKPEFNKHYKAVHQKSVYTCSKCLRRFKLMKTYSKHMKVHDEEHLKKFKCTLCGYQGIDNWTLKRHTAKIHKKQTTFEEVCQAALGTKNFKCSRSIVAIQINIPVVVVENRNELDDKERKDTLADLFDQNPDGTDKETHKNDTDEDFVFDDSDGHSSESTTTDENSDSAPGVVHETTLSRYEQIRENNIQEFRAFVARSGVLESISELKQELLADTVNVKKTKTKRRKQNVHQDPTRRSQRIASLSSKSITECLEDSDSESDTSGSETESIEKVNKRQDISSIGLRSLNIGNGNIKAEGNFLCEICGYVCRDSFNLKRHSKMKHSIVNVKCSRCNLVFFDKFSLIDHNRKCAFNCTYPNCNKKFRYMYNLESHKRWHTNNAKRYL